MKISISKNEYSHVANILNDRNVATFVNVAAFNGIMKDGKIKTLADLGNSATNNKDNDCAKSLRKMQEGRFLFGDSTLYGTFVNRSSIRHEFTKGNNGYGNIALVWKDEVKRNGIAFLGDSIVSHKTVGHPILGLNGVTAKSAEFWLAQYGVYDNKPTSYIDFNEGFTQIKTNVRKFDVDYESMKKSIGGKFNLIEVLHKGKLSFPFDIQYIVVSNANWIAPTKQHLNNIKSKCLVVSVDDYYDEKDL